ncbi:hypothetical protein TNCV_3572061 [Trichonephila clavipes]|nr:hypothetical protein TNCV_3572061 [Trichonephila clavipes]
MWKKTREEEMSGILGKEHNFEIVKEETTGQRCAEPKWTSPCSLKESFLVRGEIRDRYETDIGSRREIRERSVKEKKGLHVLAGS